MAAIERTERAETPATTSRDGGRTGGGGGGRRRAEAAEWRASAMAESPAEADGLPRGNWVASLAGRERTRAVFKGVPILRVSLSRRYTVADGGEFAVASYPKKLHMACRHRGAMVVVPSYSLPAGGAACPTAVYDSAIAAEAVAEWGAPREAVADAVAEAEARTICGGCYMVRLARLRANVRGAHDARFAEAVRMVRAWSRSGRILGEAVRLRAAHMVAEAACDAIANGREAETWPPEVARAVRLATYGEAEDGASAVAEWAAIAWRIIRSMSAGLSRQLECAECAAEDIRMRWHMGGDIFAVSYAAILRHVIWRALLDLYTALRIWNPTRGWHGRVPHRLRAAIESLAEWGASAETGGRVIVSASALLVGEAVPDSVARRFGGASAVARDAEAVASLPAEYSAGGPCAAQSENVTHSCEDCRVCYTPRNRVPYLLH